MGWEEMSIRLLTKEEILGDGTNPPLVAIQTYGKDATVSDLATLLGGPSTAAVRTIEGEYATDYFTQSSQDNEAVVLKAVQIQGVISPTVRYPVIRPVIEPVEMPFAESPETMYPLRLANGSQIGVCQYGFYPQKYVGDHLSARLEASFNDQKEDLVETGQSFTLPKNYVDDLNQPFETEKYPVYRFENKSYIRVEPHMRSTAARTFNGMPILLNKSYWISVDPIEWLMDDTGVLIAKDGLIAGIPLLADDDQEYSGDFRKTLLSEFLKKNFVSEAGIKVKMFEPMRWLDEHPNPTKEDFLAVPEGEYKNTVNLLTEAGIDVLRKAFPSQKWANMNCKKDLHEIFSTVDISNDKNRLTLKCLNARFEAYYHKHMVLQKEIMLRNSSGRGGC